MYDDERSPTNEQRSQPTPASSRRRFLKGATATGVTVAGLGGATTAASAQLFGAETVSLSKRNGSMNADGSLPVVDELVVFVHGWFGNTGVGFQASSVSGSLENGGYTPDSTVGIEWPAFNFNIVGAMGDTELVGETVASLAEDFYDAGGGNVRLVGHSLGGRCVYWTMTKLSSGYELETVAGLGAAGTGWELCDQPWNPGFENACDVRNYHSSNDAVIGGSYAAAPGSALGAEGADCDPAPNYADVDVTDDVGSHLGYLGNAAVGTDLGESIRNGSCDGGSSGGDGGSTGGDSGWFGSGGDGGSTDGSTGDDGGWFGTDDGGSGGSGESGTESGWW